jgi:diguanylate cyclase (GGDEF)-like protein
MTARTIISLIYLCFSLAGASAALPDPLRVAVSDDTYPYMYTDEQGQLAGLVIDYWQEVGRRGGVQLQFVSGNWPQTIALLQSNAVHLHGGIAYTAGREQRYHLGDTGIDVYSNVFIQRDIPPVNALSELKAYAIGVVDKSSHVDTIAALVPEVALKYYPNVTVMYDAALAGDIKVISGLDRLPPRYVRYAELQQQFPLYRKMPLRKIDLNYAVNGNADLAQQLAVLTLSIERDYLDKLERRWLGGAADDDTVILGVPIDNQPYMHVSAQGQAQGLLVDLWRKWSEKTGIKVAFVPDSSVNLLNSLQKNRIDALVAFPNASDLPAGLDKAYHLYSFNSEFYYPRQNSVTSMSDISGSRVGLFRNATYFDELQRRYPDTEFVRYSALSEMVAAVQSGELAGFYGASAIIDLRLQQLNLRDYFSSLADSRVKAPLYSIIKADRPQLKEQIRQGFNLLSLTELEQVEAHWLMNPDQHYFSLFRNSVPLTDDEQGWLAKHNPIRVGMLDNWAPMEFVDKEGNFAGVTVDILQLLGQRTGISFDIKRYSRFEQMLVDLQQRHIDMVANVSDVAERREYASFTDEFWSVQWAVISQQNDSDISSAAGLAGKRIAMMKDYQLAQHSAEALPQSSVVLVENVRRGLTLLQQGKVDYLLDSVETASQLLRQTGYINLRIQLIDDLPVYPSLIAVRNDYQPLVTILNKGLRSIGQTERNQLYQRWFDFQITQGINNEQFVRMLWQIGGAVLALLSFFVIWNLSLRREVTLRRQAEQKMRFMATHDDLTKLPNRGLIKERIEQALLQHARHNEIMALLFIDLDGFKEVNDAHGHDAGDELLLKLAQQLSATVRKSDTVARFGGDEFVILLTGLLSREDAAIVAGKILHQLAQPVSLSVGEVQVGASIGIAIYPDDGTDSAKLLKVADSLMYRIKQQGKNQYCFSRAVFS